MALRPRPNRALVPALSGVAAMLVVGVLVAVVAVLLTRGGGGGEKREDSVAFDLPAGLAIEDDLRAAVVRTLQGSSDENWMVTTADLEQQQAVLYAVTANGSPHPTVLLAERNGDHWSVVDGSSEQFCGELADLPESLMGGQSKMYFAGCSP